MSSEKQLRGARRGRVWQVMEKTLAFRASRHWGSSEPRTQKQFDLISKFSREWRMGSNLGIWERSYFVTDGGCQRALELGSPRSPA